MKNYANIEFLRKRFDKVNSYYGAKGLAPQLSLLRIEENLVDGKGVYDFNIKKENLSGVESNLKRNDLFVTISLAIATRIEVEAQPNVNVPNFSPLIGQTHDSSGTTVVDLAGFSTDDILALYNGSLQINTGTTVNFADLPTALFLRQQSDDVSTIFGTSVEVRNKKFNFVDDMQVMAEEVIFAGTQDHKIQLSFPTYANANYSATDGATAKVVFMALGWRVVGGTSETYKNDSANPYKGCI